MAFIKNWNTNKLCKFCKVCNLYFGFYVYIWPLSDKSKSSYIMLGEKLKELRESKGLLQRQIAAELEVDTAYISKIESNEKPVSRNHLKKLSIILGISDDELLTLWIADKIFDLAKDEDLALNAIKVAEKELIKLKKLGK